jgi:glycosidase
MAERGTPTIYYGDEIGLTINAAAELPACGSKRRGPAVIRNIVVRASSSRKRKGAGAAIASPIPRARPGTA